MVIVIETCRQQYRNTFEYLAAQVKVSSSGRQANSLTPRQGVNGYGPTQVSLHFRGARAARGVRRE